MSIEDISKLLEYIEGNLKPKDKEKKERGEVFTPISLIEEMLDKLPSEVWNNPNLKWLDPAAGIGNFPIVIYLRLMKGLSEDIPDEEARRRHILEKMLFMVEINPNNVSTLNRIFCGDKYCLNIFEGSFIDGNDIDGRPYERVFNPKMEFDVVVGNPPYNKGGTGTGNSIWPLFVSKSLNEWLIEGGYLLYVHPRGWRQINSKVGNIMKEKQIIYLNMNSVNKGLETFKCATDYDYYLIENTSVYKETKIVDYKNENYQYMINKELKFIPNHSLNEVFDLIHNVEDNGFMSSKSVYETRRKWMSKNQSNEYKYPCVYSINSKNVISKKWSNRNDNGHFGITKFIFSNGNGSYKDYNGEYGLTEWAYAIKCKKEDMDNVEKSFNSDKFINIVDAINLTSNKFNYNVIKLFKKDFWEEFI